MLKYFKTINMNSCKTFCISLCSILLLSFNGMGQNNASISGTVYNDIVGNGSIIGMPTLSNVTVNLSSGSQLITTTTTNDFGMYTFSNLASGTYIVSVSLATGWQQKYPFGGVNYTLTVYSGSETPSSTANNFGLHYACCNNPTISVSKYINTPPPPNINALEVPPPIQIDPHPFNFCPGTMLSFNLGCDGITNDGSYTYSWNFGDGTSAAAMSPTHQYATAGTYTATLTFSRPGSEIGGNITCAPQQVQLVVLVSECTEVCTDCIGSFAPTPGDYLIGFWVREDRATQIPYYTSGVIISFYTDAAATVEIPNTRVNAVAEQSNNVMIEGWQRVEFAFTVPQTATTMKIELNAASIADTYFDDIRIHPFDASLKSYVYDPINLRLMAELDENNYATFYEYDEEGALIRVKKETVKGVMTIKESRNKNATK